MKKVFLIVSILTASFVQAQVGVEKSDSIIMGNSYLNDVYYLLKDGSQSMQPTNNWHIAFRTGGQTDGIRVNTATASGPEDGAASIYVYPNGALADWATMDTTGNSTWVALNNSDKTWEIGALNTTSGQFPDFGWGVYNTGTHVVTGDSIYLVKYKLAGLVKYKKLYVEKKESSNWFFKFADIDGTNETNVELKSSDYAGKNYIYYNLETGTALDREPAAWDFVLTRYAALQNNGSYFPATGILTNIGVYAAKAEGKEVADLDLADTTVGFIGTIDVIGYNWKDYVPVWHTLDSVAYFVQDRQGILWKVAFTAFGGAANGKTVFSKTQMTPGVSVREVDAAILQTSVYPNPAQGTTHVVFSAVASGTASLRILDINGREIQQSNLNIVAGVQSFELDLSAMEQGVYFVQVSANGFQSTQKLIKN